MITTSANDGHFMEDLRNCDAISSAATPFSSAAKLSGGRPAGGALEDGRKSAVLFHQSDAAGPPG
jgi:hypothetical protein